MALLSMQKNLCLIRARTSPAQNCARFRRAKVNKPDFRHANHINNGFGSTFFQKWKKGYGFNQYPCM